MTIWEDRTSNAYWTSGLASGEWTGDAWQSNQGVGANQYITLNIPEEFTPEYELEDDWATGYFPEYIRITFEGVAAVEWFLLDLSANYLVLKDNASSPDTETITYFGNRIHHFTVFAKDPPTQQFRVTNIEFGFVEDSSSASLSPSASLSLSSSFSESASPSPAPSEEPVQETQTTQRVLHNPRMVNRHQVPPILTQRTPGVVDLRSYKFATQPGKGKPKKGGR